MQEKKCPECNNWFMTRTPMKLACSDECARRRKTRKQLAARRAREVAANERAFALHKK